MEGVRTEVQDADAPRLVALRLGRPRAALPLPSDDPEAPPRPGRAGHREAARRFAYPRRSAGRTEKIARSSTIFAITSDGRIGWFHPAWEHAADDPKTLPLPSSPDPRLLSDAVTLPLGRGPVRIVCWQSSRRWSVRDADAAVARDVAGRPDATTLDRIDALGGTQSGVRLSFD